MDKIPNKGEWHFERDPNAVVDESPRTDEYYQKLIEDACRKVRDTQQFR